MSSADGGSCAVRPDTSFISLRPNSMVADLSVKPGIRLVAS
ncbi:MAG: hypothetical protein NTZ32_11800 [Planctomycetales bacterium]|nr:hypothetical protein [Planctomycetales bacterium]